MQPQERHPRQTQSQHQQQQHQQRRNRLLRHKARKGDAELPNDMQLFFLELDAEFNAERDRAREEPLLAQALQDMRNQLDREKAAILRRERMYTDAESMTSSDGSISPEIVPVQEQSQVGVSGMDADVVEAGMSSQSVLDAVVCPIQQL
ncbi:hypothetical protein HDU80_006087 [Chytriomyces hyalinus]|nr:hypothetical protein HDU80_006085 [Chytriomyces hyalinus]KAJ3401363.1 hypothetical protein HDU80_006087 [Chytriomyces hyalinus]